MPERINQLNNEQEDFTQGLDYPAENEAGFEGLMSGKSPDLGDAEKKQEKTEQQMAKEKLEMLKNPEFKEFAIRFMTKDEYENMMSTGNLQPGREVYVFNEANNNALPFSDYLEANKGDWRNAIYRQTEWSHGNADLDIAHDFIRLLYEAHKKQRQESPDDKTDIRQKTLLLFRDVMKKRLSNEGLKNDNESEIAKVYYDAESQVDIENQVKILKTVYESLNPYSELEKQSRIRKKIARGSLIEFDFSAIGARVIIDTEESLDKINEVIKNEIKHQIEPCLKRSSERQDRLKEKYGEQYEKVKIVESFISNPEWLSEDQQNLRKLFDALIYLKQKGTPQEESQYHIGVVIELPAVMTGLIKDGLWGITKTKGDEKYNQSEHIFGAITLMPDKKLIDFVKSLSAQAGPLAHPVFNNKGSVMFPKESLIHQ